jgi:hypothetical protein
MTAYGGTPVRASTEGINRAREVKATCDKRNLHPLIALALAAMFAVAGSAATAESPLTGENARELERLLRVPAENKAVDFAFKKPPRIPASTLDRYFMWNEIALDTTAIDHTPVASGEDRQFGEQLGPPRSARAMAIIHIAMFDAENAVTKKFVSYSGIPAVSGSIAGPGHRPGGARHPGRSISFSKGPPRRDF